MLTSRSVDPKSSDNLYISPLGDTKQDPSVERVVGKADRVWKRGALVLYDKLTKLVLIVLENRLLLVRCFIYRKFTLNTLANELRYICTLSPTKWLICM